MPTCRALLAITLLLLAERGPCRALAQAPASSNGPPTAAAAAAGPASPAALSDGAEVELPQRLLDRPPFDRIALNAANNGAVIETVLLDLPD
ncbi:MAG TPA: hypothetical protein VEQ85_08460, partial [Lacipirellulaceae bacterium]|nr:hypothetical protein [Lacipirellulaceae bacterium]